MRFGEERIEDAAGGYLAHSISLPQGRLRKGAEVTNELIKRLHDSGLKQVTIARLDRDDVHEDMAAKILAIAVLGPGLRCSTSATGRVNIYAKQSGLFFVCRERILAVNAVDPSLSIATIPENQWVKADTIVATVKIIPYAVPQELLYKAVKTCKNIAAADESAPLQLYPPSQHRAHLIQTSRGAGKRHLLIKTENVTHQRLRDRECALVTSSVCDHTSDALTVQIITLSQSTDCRPEDWFLIVGSSAICDKRDVIPQAIANACGNVQRFGIPVEPGNLLLLGNFNKHRVIGLPGCARSPKLNGFDQVLDRMACGLPITDDWINSLAIGGLLL